MRVYFHTFGCRANQYDTDVVRQRFSDDGAVVVDDPALADIAIINSCTVTHESEVKLRRFVRHVAKSGAAQTIVMGCAAALDDGSIAALPSVRAVVANADPDSVLRAAGVTAIRAGAQHAAPLPFNGRYRALLKIQDGCDEHCTFCATTMARGANRSRSADDLVAEAVQLADRHAEIVLTGIHIGTWGRDIGSTLGDLVGRLVRDVPRVRFRLSSVEATEVDGALRELFQEPERLAPHLHAPLQSGSDRVLARMRRDYTVSEYKALVARMRAALPGITLTTDIIVGFPGEEERDFVATLDLVENIGYESAFMFKYSERPGTFAARA